MSQTTAIGQVARRMTHAEFIGAAERFERESAVNMRQAQAELEARASREWAKTRERESLQALGRPEYRSLRHALWKEKLYERYRNLAEWEAYQDCKRVERIEERERKKAEWQAWQASPRETPVNLEYMPAF